jgi:integrase/recombinase XerD
METIQEAIKAFLAHCQYEKNLDPKTLKAYGIDLKQLKAFLIEKGYSTGILEVNKAALRDYIQSLAGVKPKTVKRKIASTKALFNFLEFEDEIPVSPFRKMKIQIREPKSLPNVMNIQEVGKIIQSTYRGNISEEKEKYAYAEKLRNIAVIELLFATGTRVSELSHLKAESVDLQTGQIKVRGKGNKERIIQVCNRDTLSALRNYHRCFKEKMPLCGGYFFVNRFNRRLSEQSVRFLVKKQAKRAGLEKRITPHAFRHSFATLLLEEDVDIKYIQHLLGHSSIVTTQIYTHVNREKQKQILRKHPRRSIRVNL